VPVGKAIVRDLHHRIVSRSEPDIGGIYSPHRRRIAGSAAVFPNPLKIPDLMQPQLWIKGEGISKGSRV
jgi:hypothetical protein